MLNNQVLCAISLWFLLFTNCFAAPVWEVSNHDRKMFVAGTIHVLSKNDHPLPDAFEKAYSQSNIIVLETDMHELQSAATQRKILQATIYAPGHSLSAKLSKSTHAKLLSYLNQKELDSTPLLQLRPGMLMVTLTMSELQRLGMGDTGVDAFYAHKAKTENKVLMSLESVDQQINYIANLGKGREDELIRYMLEDLNQLEQTMIKMKSLWRKGDIQALDALANEPMKRDMPEIHKTILVERNQAWLPSLRRMMQTQDTELVLVGALHLPGEYGLLKLLEQEGYKVKQL
ncbi:TraB/GumN family protein [Teredinibacter sp. KSP-S5-2]|uniref:TraB/GumN family protein n=1 Tax=Teredinibacter sp. KSP-S5-2 TaxID=3034506 RepID=UPI002934998C|nr:TraB/GumN family protein [Teredinibacter sp. KSP-S5-2]WNO09880.1 TraB/GumN family protein [Teredinibacter sp. KSP-S5-2]